jgi:Tol biopolymer transport system component
MFPGIAWSTDLNIYAVPVTGGPAKTITAANKATDTGPVYSPDGKTIAYRAMARPGFESDRLRVTLYDRATGKSRTLTEAWDRSPGSLEWFPDGKALLAAAGEALPRRHLHRRCRRHRAQATHPL